MSEVITLSSDEEDLLPQKKRAKLIPVAAAKSSEIVVLSESDGDDDNKDSKKIKPHNEIQDEPSSNGGLVEDTSEKENNALDIQPKPTEEQVGNENVKEETSTAKHIELPDYFTDFLSLFEENIIHTKYEGLKQKIPIITKLFRKCETLHSNSFSFKKIIEDSCKKVKLSEAGAVESLNDVYQYLKSTNDSQAIEVSEHCFLKLKKLDKTIRLLLAKIKSLEDQEIGDEDDEDSPYIQLEKYANRLNKVYIKRCEILNKNPYAGRLTYEKLVFVNSDYNEINRAINKKYKNNSKFPSYAEIEQCIRKCVQQCNLGLSEHQIKSESQHCFKKIGELLQHRRKKELYDAHCSYIKDFEDPASMDYSLAQTLKANVAEGKKRIDKLCDQFVVKQEIGEEVQLSEDSSENSNYVDSDVEENGNESK